MIGGYPYFKNPSYAFTRWCINVVHHSTMIMSSSISISITIITVMVVMFSINVFIVIMAIKSIKTLMQF